MYKRARRHTLLSRTYRCFQDRRLTHLYTPWLAKQGRQIGRLLPKPRLMSKKTRCLRQVYTASSEPMQTEIEASKSTLVTRSIHKPHRLPFLCHWRLLVRFRLCCLACKALLSPRVHGGGWVLVCFQGRQRGPDSVETYFISNQLRLVSSLVYVYHQSSPHPK